MPDENFDRQRVCYEQNCETFRALNNIMWQVPVIAMTLTGGLWYGVATMHVTLVVRQGLLLFSTMGNIGLIFVINRTRRVMGAYLQRIEEFSPDAFPVRSKSRFFWMRDNGVLITMSGLMAIGAFMSFVGLLVLPCITP